MSKAARIFLAASLMTVLGGGAARALPAFVNYQGRYLNNGVPSTGTVSMEFRIMNAPSGGNACGAGADSSSFYTSTSSGVPTSNGIFSYKIGYNKTGGAVDAGFALLDWTGGPYYISVCANAVELLPRELIGSNPYSFVTTSATYASKAGGNFDGQFNKVVNLADPTALQDAATKNYVDLATAAIVIANAVADGALAGANIWTNTNAFNQNVSLTGKANFSVNSGSVTVNSNVLTKSGLLDATQMTGTIPTGNLGNAVITSGANSMSGALNMNTHQINGVVDPTALQDAATKNYVDQATAAVTGAGGILSAANTWTNTNGFGKNVSLTGTANFSVASGSITVESNVLTKDGLLDAAQLTGAVPSGNLTNAGILAGDNTWSGANAFGAKRVTISTTVYSAAGEVIDTNGNINAALLAGVAPVASSATFATKAGGPFDAQGNRITNLNNTPNANTDAASKGYVDASTVAAKNYVDTTQAALLNTSTNTWNGGQTFGTHLISKPGSAAPADSNTGTDCTVAGTDVAGVITVVNNASPCTINFGTSWAAAPVCVVSGFDDSANIPTVAPTMTTVVFAAGANGKKYNYICIGL